MNTDEFDIISDSDFFNSDSDDEIFITPSPPKKKSKSKIKYKEDDMTRRTEEQKKINEKNRKKGINMLSKLNQYKNINKNNTQKKNKQIKKRNTIRNNYLLKSIKGLPKIQRYFTPKEQEKLVDIFIKQNLNNYDLDKYNFDKNAYNVLKHNLNVNLNQPQDYPRKNVQDFLQQSEYYKSALEDINNSNELSKKLKNKLNKFLNKYDNIIVAEGSKGKKRRQRRGKCTKKRKRKKKKDNSGCSCPNSGNCDCRRRAQIERQREKEIFKSKIRETIRYLSQHKEKVLEILNDNRYRTFYNKIKKYIYISNNNLIIDMNNAQSYHDLLNIKNLFVDFKSILERKIRQEQQEMRERERVDQLLRNFVDEQKIPTARVAPATVIADIYDERRPRWNRLKRSVKKNVSNLMKKITRRRGRNSRRIQPAFVVGEKKNTRRKKGKKRNKKKK